MRFGGFLGIPERSRYGLRGATLQLDFTDADGARPPVVRLRFVRNRYHFLDPAARCTA